MEVRVLPLVPILLYPNRQREQVESLYSPSSNLGSSTNIYVAQLESALPCEGKGRQFESDRRCHTSVVQWMNRCLRSILYAGSSPVTGAMRQYPNGRGNAFRPRVVQVRVLRVVPNKGLSKTALLV